MWPIVIKQWLLFRSVLTKLFLKRTLTCPLSVADSWQVYWTNFLLAGGMAQAGFQNKSPWLFLQIPGLFHITQLEKYFRTLDWAIWDTREYIFCFLKKIKLCWIALHRSGVILYCIAVVIDSHVFFMYQVSGIGINLLTRFTKPTRILVYTFIEIP